MSVTPDAALSVALLLSLGLNVIHHRHGAKCRCEQCAFHVNEHRMAALKQAELQHDMEHQSFGAGPRGGTKPDIYPCSDDTCPRNPRPK